MAKRKEYNSIFFLTVYFGLLLVSTTPQVLARAATNPIFDIKNEIEFKEDFDNKPDEDLLENPAEDFPGIFSELFSEIRAEIDGGTVKTPISDNFGAQSYTKILNVFGFEEGQASGLSESPFRIDQLCDGFIYTRILPNAFKKSDFVDLYNRGTKVGKVKEAKAKIKADQNDLIFEVSFTKAKAEIFAVYLNAKYVSLSKNAHKTHLKSFYENTKVASENNQVFVITRLPRASIDSLL